MSDPELATPDPARADADGFDFEISGGHLALDLANTISRRGDPADSSEHLIDFGRLITWSEKAGLVTPRDAERLRAEASARPRAAVSALRRAIGVREAIYALFEAIANHERAPAAALDTLNVALPDALSTLRVAADRRGFRWRFASPPDDLAPMLAPIVRAAAELLTSEERERVRVCGSGTCFWLFLDRSKNGTRRWCNMQVCGNREKARRHYRREKKKTRRGRGVPSRVG